jgi:hypothetical protein
MNCKVIVTFRKKWRMQWSKYFIDPITNKNVTAGWNAKSRKKLNPLELLHNASLTSALTSAHTHITTCKLQRKPPGKKQATADFSEALFPAEFATRSDLLAGNVHGYPNGLGVATLCQEACVMSSKL